MNTNRVVLITGAAGGVGTVLVDRFLANGDTVIATDSRKDVLDAWRERYPAVAKLEVVAADISLDEDVDALAQAAQTATGRVDVLINCAGYFPIVSFEEMTSAQWRQVIDINLTGVFLVTHAILPLMKAAGWGKIVNFSSASIFPGAPGQTHYVAAKAGIIGFTRTLAREVGDLGITVNAITPGLTVTKAVLDSFPAAILETQRAARALHRDQLPEDLVGPTFFLASEDSDFVTGQILNADGGSNMH
jgi:3-oxoacyl-[acyl-carrier protein] reductase